MMDSARLQDLTGKGWGIAAGKFGAPFQLYRPRGNLSPLAAQNRLLCLPAVFTGEGFGKPRAPDYGDALWWGYFDCAYTAPGDYLVGQATTYFVARQMPGLPVQCVQTNRVVTLVRPSGNGQSGYSGYSGFFAAPGELILLEWPASILEMASHAVPGAPLETRFGYWTLYLPKLPSPPQTADVVTDDLLQNYAVTSAEESTLGWRCTIRQIGP